MNGIVSSNVTNNGESYKLTSASIKGNGVNCINLDDSVGETTELDEKSKGDGNGMTKNKYTQFGDWYKELVTKCNLIDYTDISGCYVLRPSAYSIWEKIQRYLDNEIKKMGVENASFPLFVSEAALNTEKKHVKDFNPEVAWVTHSGDTKLKNPIAVRPTSETIMYPMFAKWINSYHDLPLKINQWCNIVRWEFKHATPFLRTREFLWQEGHTVWETKQEAINEVYQVLDMYAQTYSYICAIPTIKGVKTDIERFPGADITATVEAYIPGSGRGIQGATSHCLGTRFSCGKSFDVETKDENKDANEDVEQLEESGAFNITYLDKNNTRRHPFQNSWGFTTRSIGVMIMNHSDNRGLVLPPRAAQWQVVIIPIVLKSTDQEIKSLVNKCQEICQILNNNNIRSFIDKRDYKNQGYKFSEWELKGVPVRLEIGPRDMENESVVAARRDKRDDKGRLKKIILKWHNIEKDIFKLLDDIHDNLYQRAKEQLETNIARCQQWEDLLQNMLNRKLVLAPHCNQDDCEKRVGVLTKEHFEGLPDAAGVEQTGKAKALCIPFENTGYQPKIDYDSNLQCIVPNCRCGKATKWILFGRSY